MRLRRRSRHVRVPAETESKHFVKIILPPIHANQICDKQISFGVVSVVEADNSKLRTWRLQRIPEELIKRFGHELSTDATITVPDGRVWKMSLKKCGKDVLFCKEWPEFVKYYSLGHGYHLVFRYEGNSKFYVLIFDITCAEIWYPCETRKTNREPELDNRKRFKDLVDDVNLKSQRKPRSKGSCSSHGKQVKSECSENLSCSKREKDVANRFKLKNPFVTCTIKRDRLYVATKFAGKYLKPNVGIMLQNSKGEKWDVSCTRHSAHDRAMMIMRGWSKFVRDNDQSLSLGDPCVLELIETNPVVLKLTLLPPPHH